MKNRIIGDIEISKKVAKIIIDSNSYIIKDFENKKTWAKLPDGTTTPCYCNCRWLNTSPRHYKQIKNYLINFLIKEEITQAVNLVVGLATAGISWATYIANEFNLPIAYVRSNTKAYGIGKLVECNPKKYSRALIIDDLLFTGDSVLKSIKALKEEFNIESISLLTICSLSNKNCSENYWKEIISFGVKIYSLTDYEDILKYLEKQKKLSKNQIKEMLKYYNNPKTYKFN